MAKVKDGKVDRSIYYYDIGVENIEDNNLVNPQNSPEILTNAFERIKEINKKLEKAKKEERRKILREIEYTTEYGDKLYVDVDKVDSKTGRVEFRLVLCRTDAFPYIEQDGKLTSLTKMVNGDFNIAEVTHCILFTREMIMGAEFNFSGARPSAIASYLPTITKLMDRVTCTGKLRKDVFDRIAEDDGFSLFEICVKNTPRMRSILRDNMGLIGSFFNSIENIDTYEISIKRRKGKKKNGFYPPAGIDELGEIVKQNRDEIMTFKVSQGTYKDAIDLLSDKLVKRRSFVLTENKTINSAEIYGVINNFFDGVVVSL